MGCLRGAINQVAHKHLENTEDELLRDDNLHLQFILL